MFNHKTKSNIRISLSTVSIRLKFIGNTDSTSATSGQSLKITAKIKDKQRIRKFFYQSSKRLFRRLFAFKAYIMARQLACYVHTSGEAFDLSDKFYEVQRSETD